MLCPSLENLRGIFRTFAGFQMMLENIAGQMDEQFCVKRFIKLTGKSFCDNCRVVPSSLFQSVPAHRDTGNDIYLLYEATLSEDVCKSLCAKLADIHAVVIFKCIDSFLGFISERIKCNSAVKAKLAMVGTRLLCTDRTKGIGYFGKLFFAVCTHELIPGDKLITDGTAVGQEPVGNIPFDFSTQLHCRPP